MICGIDESGRGPVIGPMIICATLIDSYSLHSLKKIGVKDSKKISKHKRENIAEKLKEILVDYSTVIVSSNSINELMIQGINLNRIEIMAFGEAVKKLKYVPKKIFCDSCEKNTAGFSKKIKSELGSFYDISSVISMTHGEDKCPAIAAASILAKIERDYWIDKISETIGDIGSGYPGDTKTKIFLKKYYKENGEFPFETRLFWKMPQKIIHKDLSKNNYALRHNLEENIKSFV